MKIILLDSIRSMQNVGAIFRNCDGAGFEKIILTGYSPHPPRNEISKTALYSQNYIDWEYYKEPLNILRKLKKESYKIYSIELTDVSKNYKELFWNTEENICLVVWNEINGVSQEILDLSDEIIMIPMLGNKESLNVSVAAGIVMYATVS